VHIATVGFEIDRVVKPIVKMKADKVYIICKKFDDKARSCVEKVLDRIEEELQLDDNLIELKVEIYSLVHNLNVLYQIFNKEKGNHIYVNCSGGSKIQSIAGMMACMMFGGTPYYVEPEEYAYIDEMEGPMTKGMKDILWLPDYKIEYPEPQVIRGVEILNSYPKGVNKKKYIEILEKEGLIKTEGNSIHSKYSKLKNKFTKHMIKWDYITLEKLGRKTIIKITNNGKNALKIFSNEII
jgi:hypothetical protein